jgi:hypothetical protein
MTTDHHVDDTTTGSGQIDERTRKGEPLVAGEEDHIRDDLSLVVSDCRDSQGHLYIYLRRLSFVLL